MVVMTPIQAQPTASEEAVHLFQHLLTPDRLHNRKRWLHLPAERHERVPNDGAAETAFPVNETSYPSSIPESFLLIFRVPHIVTAGHPSNVKWRVCQSDE
jgi:hypothetical protein